MQNEYTTKHSELRKVSNLVGEDNDCTVHALAIVTDVDYGTAHAELTKQGRQKGRGCNQFKWLPAVNELGYVWREVTGHFEGKTMNSLERELPKGEKFLITIRGHIIAFDGNAILDYSKGRRYRIKQIWHVVPAPGENLMEEKKRVREVHTSELNDCIFFWEHPKEYRIHIRENGKVRWLNSKYSYYDAHDAARRAATKRGISFSGERDPYEVVVD